MIDLTALASRLRHARPFRVSRYAKPGMSLPIAAAICAVAAAIAGAVSGAWHSPAYADGGASARNQAAASAPDDSGAAIRGYALRILRALPDGDTNNWVRYWQARDDCQSVAAYIPAAPIDRALLALTATLCAQLDARLGVNLADHPPRGDEQTGGLLLNEPGAAAGYTLFPGRHGKEIYLIDQLGRTAHIWHIEDTLPGELAGHSKLLDNGNLLMVSVLPHDELALALREIDPRGNVVWRSDSTYGLHHDFLKMPNGNVMLLGSAAKTREQAIAAGANPEFGYELFMHEILVEVRPTGASGGEVVWQWSAWDHLVQDFDPSKPNYGAIAEHPELIDLNFLAQTVNWRDKPSLMHVNGIDYNPDLDQIVMTPRHYSELWIIDHSAATEEARGHSGGNSGMGGDLLYRWGNPRAYGHGTADDQRLFWPHNPYWIPDGIPGAGNIHVFNNGNEFSGYRRHYSSIDEIVPPVDGYRYRRAADGVYPPSEPAWTYAAETPADFYAPYASGAHRLPNGNTLIADTPAGTIFQATPDGKTAWKYVAPYRYHISLWQDERQDDPAADWLTFGATADDKPVLTRSNSVYRAYWYPPDHPGLQALDLTPGARIGEGPDLLDWARDAVLAGYFGEPIANSDFDIYMDDGNLIYFKQPCAAEDARTRFFLHIFPADARDLRADRHEHGFDRLDFGIRNYGKTSDDWCIAITSLPDYAIERIRTGQIADAGALWRADIELGE